MDGKGPAVYNSVLGISLLCRTLGSAAASDGSHLPWLCPVLAPGAGVGKHQGARQIVKNSIPRTWTPAPTSAFCSCMFSESEGFSWPAASPSGRPLPLHCSLGMCSQSAHFPPAPGSTAKEQLSLLFHSYSEGRLGCTSFCHILNLCISGTACSALHFWLSEHVERVCIGVRLGVHPSGDKRHGFSFQGLRC